MATGKVLKLRDVRLAFIQDLFIPRAYKDDPTKKKKFKCKLLIGKEHPQIDEVKEELSRLATEVWKEKAANIINSIKGDRQRFAFLDGDLSNYEGFPGNYSIAASNDTKPLFLHANPGTKENPNLITQESGVLYSGAFVIAHISFWTWDKSGPQVNCNLLGLQFYRPGEAFSGGGTSSKVEEFGNEDTSPVAQPTGASSNMFA